MPSPARRWRRAIRSTGAQTEQWISLVNTHIDPLLVRQYLAAISFRGTPDGQPDRAVIDAALPKMEPHFAVLDRAVAKTGHLVGESLTLADINLLPILFYMDKLPESRAMLRRSAQPRRVLPAPYGAAERQRNNPAAFSRPFLVGNRRAERGRRPCATCS